MDKAPDAFRTISEVADDLDIPQHVLRFWETRFSQIKPMKRSGGRRFYRPDDIDLLRGIRRLLYGEGYTIRGVQRIPREQGIKSVQGLADDKVVPPSLVRRADQDAEHDEDTPAFDDEAEADLEVEAEEDDEPEEAMAPPVAAPRPVVPPVRVDQAPGNRGGASPPNVRIDAPNARIDVEQAPGLSQPDTARLKAALDDLIACKQLVDDALKASPPELFPLK